MIVRDKIHGYSVYRKHIYGNGFTDSLTSSLRSIGSYIAQNKDLIAKPLLGAAGDLAAFGLTEGGKAVISNIVNKNKNKNYVTNPILNAKSQEILKNIMGNPTTNIIGSGIKKF